jgi:PAS domain S-box-containing protein
MECIKDYAIILLDAQGRVAEWNAGAQALFGYAVEEVIGQPFSLLFPSDDPAKPEGELRKARAEGRAEDLGWRVRKDGSRFWATGYTTALRDGNSNLLGFATVIRDRTEAKAMEDNLRVVEERFRLFMENVKDYAVFMLNPEGRVVDWNLGAEHVLGYGEEILGQPFSCFFPPEDRAKGIPEQELREAVRTGRASDDRWHVRKDGTYFWALGITTAMRDERGTLKGFTKVLRDSTERKHFEEELKRRNEALEEAARRKDEFLALLAHELRNPLAPIFNGLSILAHEDITSDIRKETRLMIDRQLRQLARLVDDLLDVSRITRGRIQLKRKTVDLRAIVNHAVETCRPFMELHKHDLMVSLPIVPIWLDGDETRLEQVFINVLNNAAKYSPDSSRIEVVAGQEGDEAVVRVRDEGIGIAPELLPHIFDLFTQGSRSLDRSPGGLGIGLTLVHKLVELHHGSVEAHSEGVGKGSQFIIRLPVGEEVPREAPKESRTGPPTAADHPLRVLVVDDNLDAVGSVKLLLTMMGHQVLTAHNGEEALQAAMDHHPDVVLLDIGLPVLNGYQVAQRIRATPDLKGTVLVALTGYGQEEDRQRAKQAGFDYHMVKPSDPQQLQQLLVMVGKCNRP